MILELSNLITQYVYSYTKFSTVSDSGLFATLYGITTFYIFGYLSARGKFDNPHQIAFDGLFPAVVVVLFLAIIGVPDVYKGIALFIVYYATIRLTSTMSTQEFVRIVLYITLSLGISAFLTREIAFVYLLTIYAVYYIQGNMRIRDNQRTKAKQKPAPAPASKDVKPAGKDDKKPEAPKSSDSLFGSIKLKK